MIMSRGGQGMPRRRRPRRRDPSNQENGKRRTVLKEYDGDHIRNVALLGSQAAGKTSLAEAILFQADVINRIGKIEEGNTQLDTMPDEIERQISIAMGVSACEWNDAKLNLLDTPGYEDFVGQVLDGLAVADAGLLLVKADQGVEVGTQRAWEMLDEAGRPRMIVVNKIDTEFADFDKTLASLQEILGKKVVPIQLPIGHAHDFKGVVDVVARAAFTYPDDQGKARKEEIPADLKDRAEELRTQLLDFAAETDEALMEKFLETETLTDEEFARGLGRAVASGGLVPVVVCSATHNKGIPQLLNAISTYLPPASTRTEVVAKKPDSEEEVRLPASSDAPVCAYVFKVVSDEHLGEMYFMRVFSGTLRPGADLYNPVHNSAERVGQLIVMSGKNREETQESGAGDVCATVKLKATHLGETLCLKDSQIVFPPPEYPEPSISMALEPKVQGEEEKIGTGLNRLREEDSTFAFGFQREVRQSILSGQGELHLDVLLARLKRRFHVEVETLKPRIPYKETVKGMSDVEAKFKKQTGGRGQYGHVHLKVEPLPRGGGFEFEDKIVGGVIPGKFIPAVEKGVREAMHEGVMAGYEIVDIKTILHYGSYHNVDSSENSFKVAGSMALKKGIQEAKPVLLEPIMNVEVRVPDEFMGDVMGDLSSRRGKIQGMDPQGHLQLVRAQVPQAELYKYATTLRSMTQGRATYRWSFSHYDEVPQEISQKIIEEYGAAQAAKK
jgi:elongation factor G